MFGSDKLGSGIDHRSYNSFVVAVGTKRANGEYRWVRSPTESDMKESPRSLIELCQRSRERKSHDPLVVPGFEVDQPDAMERFRQFAVNNAPEAVEGASGRAETIALLRRAGDYGLMALTAVEILCEPEGWNELKAHPPWDEDELLELAESLEPSRNSPIGCDHPSSQFDRVEKKEEDKAAGGNKEAPGNNKALPFWSFDPDEAPAPKGWIIKTVAAKGETAGWIGPPGSGKSALVLDWFLRGAANRDWRGHKCKQQTASVYFAFEHANLTRRRIKAYAQQWGLECAGRRGRSDAEPYGPGHDSCHSRHHQGRGGCLRDAGRGDCVRHTPERHRGGGRRRELGEGRQRGSSQPAPIHNGGTYT